MDSIITQVTQEQAREAEAVIASSSSPYYNRSSSSSSSPERRSKGFFSQLCCCCGHLWRGSRKKKTPVVEEVHNEELVASNNVHEEAAKPSVPPPGGYLLPPLLPQDSTKPCMVIDLDETLVHSSFKPIGNADFIVPVEIDGVVHQVYVAKRPYVDEFLQKMGELYECVLFTASLAKYADPVADLLDKWGVFRTRLFRDSCVFHRGNYVKDLNKLGRSLQRVVIVDNSPASYIFHPDNAVPVASWFDDISDTELLYLIPFFERLAKVDNVYTVLRNSNHPFNTPPNAAKELLPT